MVVNLVSSCEWNVVTVYLKYTLERFRFVEFFKDGTVLI